MEKLYLGNHGTEDEGWFLLGVVGSFDGVDWVAYRKKQDNDNVWEYVKVVADGKVPRKANYWLVWNGERFGAGGDFYKLVQYRRELSDMIQEFMQKIIDEQQC